MSPNFRQGPARPGRVVMPADDRPLVVRGARVLTPAGLETTDLTVDRSGIVGLASGEVAGNMIDADGLLVAPGFVDLQINGGFGYDFTTQPEHIWTVGTRLPAHGVTAFLPTIVSGSTTQVDAARAVLAGGPPPGYRGAVPLGLHLEGPMIRPEYRGTHPVEALSPPALGRVEGWSPAGGVRMVTIAPELDGAAAVIAELVVRGVVVSLGHSGAGYEQALSAIETGARFGTHLFNAMTGLHHRSPGLVGALLDSPQMVVGLIVDGIHLHPAAVRVAWRVKGPEGVALVTDAMAAMGMGRGSFRIGSVQVTVGDDGPRNPDGRLAGSDLTLDRAVRNLIAFTGCPVTDALTTVTLTPARLLGDHRRGVIASGARSDLVLLDDQLVVRATIVGGEPVYRAAS